MMNGKKLKEARLRKGETQMQVAVAIGTYPGTISRMERSDSVDVALSTAKALADHLGVTVDSLLK